MGALSDYFLFQSTRRLRGVLAAASVAMAGTCLLSLFGLPLLGTGVTAVPLLAAMIGPFAFGIGMTLSGGCITRNLVRAGHGSLKAAFTLILAALATLAVTHGILANVSGRLLAPSFEVVLPPGILASIGLIVAASIGAWVLLPAKQRTRAASEIWTGVGLGALVPIWHVLVDVDPWPIMPAYALANADLLAFLAGTAVDPILPAFVTGTLAGAAGSAAWRRTRRFEGYANAADLWRNTVGAILMGVGGGLIGACSFGLAVSGIAALLPAAFVGTFFMVLGCRQTLRVLEGRSFLSVR